MSYIGRYYFRYFDDKVNEIAGFELAIQKGGEYYGLAWIDNGVILDRSIGMEVAEGLGVGWRRVNDKPPQPLETQK